MKKRLLSFLLIMCLLSVIVGLVACDEDANDPSGDVPTGPQQLSAPQLTLVNDVASWQADANADRFEISIDGTLSQVENTVTSKTLLDGQSLKVRAIGDGVNYLTSDWSNTVTYAKPDDPIDPNPPATPTKLGTPVVTISESGLASWAHVDNATAYVYVINNGSEQTTQELSVQLQDGQSIKVKATVTGTMEYTDGDYSAVVTYTAPENPDIPEPPLTPTKLGTPVVTIAESGMATWTAIEYAVGYKYVIDNGTEQSTTAISVQLTDGQSIKVKAVGDGVDYADGDYSAVVTYDAPEVQVPVQLTAPVVTINEDGVASWTAVDNAIGYKYVINNGAEQNTTSLAVLLTNGQSIKVKAIGNGVDYLSSDYSAVVTYNTTEEPEDPEDPENPSDPTAAPTYLGIFASNDAPSNSDIPGNLAMAAVYSNFEEAIRAFLADENNSLGETAPVASNYTVYSSIGSTVYVQIWLDNPDQNTILSLKLNGTKYQSGGDLQSFFIESGDTYLNCVYVAITIPTAYEEIVYEVTEIEYVEGSNISQDGKSVLIDEDNDTVAIGLPYQASMPTLDLETSSGDVTASKIMINFDIIDEDNYVELIGGWLRVIACKTFTYEIVAQAKLVTGNNDIVFENLQADTCYDVKVFLLGDTHDGNGVYYHEILSDTIWTSKAVEVTVEPERLYNETTGKYYPNISVETVLNDTSFSFTKVEVHTYSYAGPTELVFSDTFDGSADISEGILCDKDYTVRVYFENALGVEQYEDQYVYTVGFDYPWTSKEFEYGLVDDVILGFNFGEGKYNIDNVVAKIYSEDSKNYLAESAVTLIENPNAVEDLETQWNSLEFGSDEWSAMGSKLNKLRDEKDKIEEYYSDVNENEWRALLEEGIYTYEFVLGEDEEFFRGDANNYYVVIPDFQTKRVNDDSWRILITADLDKNTGEGIKNINLVDNMWFSTAPAISDNDYLFTVYNSELGKEMFYVDDDNVVYLEVMSRNNLGNESYKMLGYVNQIALFRDYDQLTKVLWSQEAPNSTIDESAWLESIKAILLTGGEDLENDVDELFPLGNLQPISFDLDDVDLSDVPAGSYTIRYTYIMFGKEYTEEHKYDVDGYIDYAVTGPLPTATININTDANEAYGQFEIVIPESLNGGWWNVYDIEVRNADEELVGSYNQDNYYEIGNLSAGYSIRIMLKASEYVPYYTDGDWSDWYVCSAAKCATPENLTQFYSSDGVTLQWDYVSGAEKYVYVLNGGAEKETYNTCIDGLVNGDTIKIKAVPTTESGYLESDYTAVFTIEDTRIMLATPVVTFDSYYRTLTWESIEYASYYMVYNATTGGVYHEYIDGTTCSIEMGNLYVVKAIPSDYNTYCASQSAVIDTVVKLDTPIISIGEDGAVTFSTYSVGGRVTYTYVINNGEEQTTTKANGITLTEGDSIKVKVSCNGYVDSDWSEVATFGTIDSDEPISLTIAQLNANYANYVTNETAITISGVVYAVDNLGFYLKDDTANVYVKTDYSELSIGHNMVVTGKATQYYSMPQFVPTEVVYNTIESNYSVPASVKTIAEIISENTAQSSTVYDHRVYRTSGTVTQDGDYYYLVDGENQLQLYTATYTGDADTFKSFVNEEISISIVIADCFTTTGIFRFSPLRGDQASINLQLATPVVTISESGLASWVAIENASGYKYIINDGEEQTAVDVSVQLVSGDSIKVKAVGNNVLYVDSEYSEVLTYVGSEEDDTFTISDFNENFNDYLETPVTLTGVVYALDGSGFYIKDNTANVYVKTAFEGLYIGQNMTVTGTANQYYTMPQLVATEVIYGSVIANYTITPIERTIAEIISENDDQSNCVYDHKVYRTRGKVTTDGSKYYLVDGENKLEIKSSTYSEDYSLLQTDYLNKTITLNIVLGDMFTTSSLFRVSPLRGSYMDVTDDEPDHIVTTVADLVATPPTNTEAIVYEVTGTWTLDTSKASAATYGNGFLSDENDNQLTVYGLCSDASVITYDATTAVYTYTNNQTYSSIGLSDGAVITIGMLYSTSYGTYKCYLIEIISIPNSTDINVISINDTHGALIDSAEGVSIGRVHKFIQEQEEANGDYIFIHGGDAFQGSYVCGETYGLAMIEALNCMSLDCFVVGNHEFDWGIDKIAAYADGNAENGEANFPFLGANIFYKDTTTRPDWIDAYTIVEQDGLKVGIIGIMGEGQETDILTRYVKDYVFASPVGIIEDTAEYLRLTEGCDSIIVAMHEYDSALNNSIAQLSGDSKVDAIIGAHTHQNITEQVTRSDGKAIPAVQCNDKNNNAKELVLKYDASKNYTSYTAQTHYFYDNYTQSYTHSISTEVAAVIAKYQSYIDDGNTSIGTVNGGLGKPDLGGYAVEEMLNNAYTNYEDFDNGAVDIAMMNTGGVRAEIDDGDITKAEVFEVFPFNNSVVLVNISGALIKQMCSENGGYMYFKVSAAIGNYANFENDTIYQMAVIDFVFENTRYDSIFGGLSEDDYIQTDLVLRNLLMSYIDTKY